MRSTLTAGIFFLFGTSTAFGRANLDILSEDMVVLDKVSAQTVDAKIEKNQEWNLLVGGDFLRIAEEAESRAKPLQFEELQSEVNYLSFATMEQQLLAMGGRTGAAPNPNSPQFFATVYSALPRQESDFSDQIKIISAQLFRGRRDESGSTWNESWNESPRREMVFVEGLDSQFRGISQVKVDEISTEVSWKGGPSRGWTYASSSPDYWGTLYWRDTTLEDFGTVPLFSSNTVKSLAAFRPGFASQHSGAGMISGKIAAGWQVELSAEDQVGQGEPLYFNAEGRLLNGNEGQNEERQFVLGNVNPGARILSFRNQSGERGGIPIPVMAGTTTYMNLSQIRTDQVISGVLYDESDPETGQVWPLDGSLVTAIGQSLPPVATDHDGNFLISKVVSAYSYPFVVDSCKVVEYQDGHTQCEGHIHRYQVSAQQSENLQLYRISEDDTSAWKKQVQGENGGDGGLAIAAFIGRNSSKSTSWLEPGAFSLLPSSGMAPESFTLSSRGDLQSGSFAPKGMKRVLSARLPEGPNVIRVNDPVQSKTVWSELVFAKPNVVNMIGPYPVEALAP